ncbi:tetratricopeptide repeat protein [Skermania piniformis]|uniref:Tetratricopeptide repeat protein n=1 Tax=Skermania pinensis TaxID=39122 RepID=A0ABX8SA79_9ACTN|nr:tetratricopeptide repeat protein [Skermania piniformis]QXQ14769.1 tetratricopeptide repeat protein [Skermania piniformis]
MSGAVDLSALKERAEAAAAGGRSAGSAGSGTAIVVTEENFESEVLQRSNQVPVVVALVSPRSPASLELADTLARLAATDGGSWVVARIEVDQNVRIAQAFGVQAIPTVVAVAAGQPLADFEGVQSEAQLRQWVDAVVGAVAGKLAGAPQTEPAEEPEDPRFTAAEAALDRGDYAGAAAAYQQIVDTEPGNAEAKAALRQVGFLARVREVESDTVAVADADPDNLDAQLAAADLEVFKQQPAAAFDRLIGLIGRTAGAERTTARTRLLELFELFDPAEPFVVAARRKLASALY